MSLPRPVVENRSYMVTRRCAERRFYLRPCKGGEQAFLFYLAVAAQRYGVVVYWVCVLSNHYHLGIRDVRGSCPKFLQFLHTLLARCLNVHLGRWENLWSSEQPPSSRRCSTLRAGIAGSGGKTESGSRLTRGGRRITL